MKKESKLGGLGNGNERGIARDEGGITLEDEEGEIVGMKQESQHY